MRGQILPGCRLTPAVLCLLPPGTVFVNLHEFRRDPPCLYTCYSGVRHAWGSLAGLIFRYD